MEILEVVDFELVIYVVSYMFDFIFDFNSFLFELYELLYFERWLIIVCLYCTVAV